MSSNPNVRQIAPEDVIVTSRGPVPPGMVQDAKEQVSHAARLSGREVLDATVTLTEQTNPARADQSRVEVEFNISGTPVRAEADAPTTAQALDGAMARLERQIVDLVSRWDDRSRWVQATKDGEWRSGDLPTDRPEHFPRPVDEREVVRRKTFGVAPATAQEAVFDMEALGHDFHLFTDVTTGSPALVHRRTDGSYGVAGLGDHADEAEGMTAKPAPPTLDEVTARQRLDDGGEPFVFYIDQATGRGSVVYLRYDGHYGVVATT